jgi:hypothetical protein
LTTEHVFFAAYAGLAAVLIVLELYRSIRGGLTLRQSVGWLTRNRVTLVALILAWTWLGWHLFVRGGAAYLH